MAGQVAETVDCPYYIQSGQEDASCDIFFLNILYLILMFQIVRDMTYSAACWPSPSVRNHGEDTRQLSPGGGGGAQGQNDCVGDDEQLDQVFLHTELYASGLEGP